MPESKGQHQMASFLVSILLAQSYSLQLSPFPSFDLSSLSSPPLCHSSLSPSFIILSLCCPFISPSVTLSLLLQCVPAVIVSAIIYFN